jgi:hypothetical protein
LHDHERFRFGIDVYPSTTPGVALAPITVTVVVSGINTQRQGVSGHVVTTTRIASCQVGTAC